VGGHQQFQSKARIRYEFGRFAFPEKASSLDFDHLVGGNRCLKCPGKKSGTEIFPDHDGQFENLASYVLLNPTRQDVCFIEKGGSDRKNHSAASRVYFFSKRSNP
jgi:hypothetical protein